MAEEVTRGRRRTKTGVVVSDKMDKTIVVAVETLRKHPIYGRTVRRTRKFKAHDPENAAHVGDTVVIMESRPFSREKHWVLREIVRRGAGVQPAGAEEVTQR